MKAKKQPANAAIYYVREAYSTDVPKLMGRNAAGASFLGGLARHARVSPAIGYARSAQDYAEFEKAMKAGGARECAWIPFGNLSRLAEAGALFQYAPGVADLAWQRRFGSPAAWSVVGFTHTISSDRVMEDIGQLLTGPVEPWDALICASSAVKKTVEGVLQGYGKYLGERLKSKHVRPRLELPVIPLGVDCDAFLQGEKLAQARARIRARLELKDDDVVFMFLGRLSFHAKVHPLPIYLALEQAARRTGRKLTLILCGYFFNPGIQKQFLDGAKLYCPSVRIVHFDGRKAEARIASWAAADVFTSFSDNIQESFGLAPVEAMAAGLPVVVSDWDGYRDTVDEESGISVPTAMPGAGAGEDLALRYLSGIDNYDLYIGQVGQCTAVDVAAATEAYVALIENPALRRKMGEAGRARARKLFDWSVVIRAYEELWAELAARRPAQKGGQKLQAGGGYPLRDDPFAAFRAFPSFAIGAGTVVEPLAKDPRAEAARIGKSGMNNFALKLMLAKEEFDKLFAELAKGKRVKLRELEALLPAARRAALARTVGWLAKGGIVRLHRS
jgi:glycosyltransferase involved in cell wall biosynthesis